MQELSDNLGGEKTLKLDHAGWNYVKGRMNINENMINYMRDHVKPFALKVLKLMDLVCTKSSYAKLSYLNQQERMTKVVEGLKDLVKNSPLHI